MVGKDSGCLWVVVWSALLIDGCSEPSRTIIPTPGQRAAPIVYGPMGDVESPALLEWEHRDAFSAYQIWVGVDDANVTHDEWHEIDALACSGRRCSLDSASIGLSHDRIYRFSVRGKSTTAQTSAWSGRVQFRITDPVDPTDPADPEARKVIIHAPIGEVASTPLMVRWSHLDVHTWYELWLEEASSREVLYDEWHKTSELQCKNGQCTFECDAWSVVAGGNYRLWIRGWTKSDGDSPWSEDARFSVQASDPPPEPTEIILSPRGSVSYDFAYRWRQLGDSTRYQLWWTNRSGETKTLWVNAACEQGICTAAAAQTGGHGIQHLIPGWEYRLWVRGQLSDGSNTDWSEEARFRVALAPNAYAPNSACPQGRRTIDMSSAGQFVPVEGEDSAFGFGYIRPGETRTYCLDVSQWVHRLQFGINGAGNQCDRVTVSVRSNDFDIPAQGTASRFDLVASRVDLALIPPGTILVEYLGHEASACNPIRYQGGVEPRRDNEF